MNKVYKLVNLKRVTFIDKSLLGQVAKLDGEKYYEVVCDIRYENNSSDYEELGNLYFTMNQSDLDKFLVSKKIDYDKVKREFEVIN